jgi:zona occludens toxin (predicted ATPase)
MVNLQDNKATYEAYAMCKPQKLKTYRKKTSPKNITKVMKSTNETQTKKKKKNLHMPHK